MAPIQIRRAISLVKDKTSIGIAKAAGNADGALEALIVKATSHDAGAAPAEKHLDEIVARTYVSKPRAYSCVTSLSKRLERTRDWAVALKALIVVHRLVAHGGKAVRDEIEHATCGRFGGLLDLSGFRDEAHSDSWDYSEFVRSYAVYLGEKVRVLGEEEELIREDDEGRGFGRVKRLQGLLDRVLRCRPSGVARSNKIVIAAVYMVAADSFDVYGDLCEGLSGIVDGFSELGFESSAMALELYVKAKPQIDGLFEYYGMCRDVGVGSSVSYPEVHRISDDLIKSLEEFLKAKLSVSSSQVEEVSGSSISIPSGETKEGIWMLPPPAMDEIASVTGDLIDLEEEHADDMALTLFSESSASDNSDRACEDWELALVESASDLARQREEYLSGRFDSLVLNGMYDQAAVSSMPLLVPVPRPMSVWKNAVPVEASPGPNGVVGGVSEDPFAASLAVPPPSYVQMADMERKQRLWRQYGSVGGITQLGMMNQNSTRKPEALY